MTEFINEHLTIIVVLAIVLALPVFRWLFVVVIFDLDDLVDYFKSDSDTDFSD